MAQVIVIGGGLSGLSAAHTVLERGGRVLVLDKNGFMGGNSTKATSGINGTVTKTQVRLGIKDSTEAFLRDTAISASKGKSDVPSDLAKVLVNESGAAVDWLQDKFKLDLSLVSQLGGHSYPRTHRGKEKFPGMTITFALMEALEAVAEKDPQRARIILKARATRLLTDKTGAVVGVAYEKDGREFTEHGPVIIATGGYGADFSPDSLLMKHRPDLAHLPTTNGEHCTGDGIKMALAVGAATKDIEWVQVHPTGLVNPKSPDDKVKFLAAEALRGVGGMMITRHGKRFCNEMGRRDYVSEMMMKNDGPFRLVLNSKSSKEIEWHCKHYKGRGLFEFYNSGAELAKAMGIAPSVLEATFNAHNKAAEAGKDEYGKTFFHNGPFVMNDQFYVGLVTPVVHYCMGGVYTSPASEVLTAEGKPVPGLYVTGEAMGGTHGQNRLGGSSLLDCVVFGRVAGNSVAKYQLSHLTAARRLGGIVGQLGAEGPKITMAVHPSESRFSLEVNWDGSASGAADAGAAAQAPAASGSTRSGAHPDDTAAVAAAAAAAKPAAPAKKQYTMEEVAKHNTPTDCWVVVGDEVLDVTKFLPDHPGGKQAILLFAGKDATEEFDMLHQRSVIAKYADYARIGTVKK